MLDAGSAFYKPRMHNVDQHCITYMLQKYEKIYQYFKDGTELSGTKQYTGREDREHKPHSCSEGETRYSKKWASLTK